MPITYDITKDKLYLRGIKAGEENAEKIAKEQIEATQRQ